MGKKSAPPAPDYAAAATQTAQGNLANAQIAQAANMVNQFTPDGSVTYTPTTTGYTDASGNRLTIDQYNQQKRENDRIASMSEKDRKRLGLTVKDVGGWVPIEQWSQRVNLSPDQKILYDQNVNINKDLGNVAQQGVGYVSDALNKPLSFDQMYDAGDPTKIHQDASDAAYKNATRYMDRQFSNRQQSTENQLANQGITRGSEAWTREMQDLDQSRNEAYDSARNQAYLQGLQGANQFYNQGMGLRQQQIAEEQTLRQDPINMLNAVRTGQQMQVAQQPSVGTSSPGQMATVGGADMLGAAQAQGQYALDAQKQKNAAMNNTMSGLFGIGAAAAGNPAAVAAMMSDRRSKQNIKLIGHGKFELPLYEFEYKPQFKIDGKHIGHMADDVEKVMPWAVVEMDNGYKGVKYGEIYG